MKSRITAVAAAVAAVAATASAPAAPVAAPSSVAQCHTLVYKSGPVFVTSARNLTCLAAKREQARYKWTGKNTFRTPGGYSCKPSGRGAIGYQIRCAKGTKAYRIEFAD